MSTNGSVNFFETPLDAAYQAAADANRFAVGLGTSGPNPADIAGATIAAVAGAIIYAVTTIANVVGAAVSIAQMVRDADDESVLDTLEIDVINNTSQSIVLANYIPSKCDVTQVVQPLLPTASDTFVITSGSVGTFNSTSALTLSFVIGSSANTIATNVALNYTGTAWTSTMTIDGSAGSAESEVELSGAQFLAENSGFPSFSVYTTPIATPSGKISLAFYDTAAS